MLSAPKLLVRRVRLWLDAHNVYDDEQAKEIKQQQQDAIEKARQDAQRR